MREKRKTKRKKCKKPAKIKCISKKTKKIKWTHSDPVNPGE